jgi:Zn-dependent protease
VANAFGDDTAKRAGRLSLNPIVHVDPVGTLIVPALLSLAGAGVFGWAKPVPVNTGRLRSPRNEGVLVSLAGPATNALIAAVSAFAFIHFVRPGLPAFGQIPTGALIVFYIGLVNVWLCIFNLIPIPPLDGSVLLERLLPARAWPTYLRYRQYTMPILVGLVLLNFFLYPHGPITWLFNQLLTWWVNVLGIYPGANRPMASAARAYVAAATSWAWAAPCASTSETHGRFSSSSDRRSLIGRSSSHNAAATSFLRSP